MAQKFNPRLMEDGFLKEVEDAKNLGVEEAARRRFDQLYSKIDKESVRERAAKAVEKKNILGNDATAGYFCLSLAGPSCRDARTAFFCKDFISARLKFIIAHLI